MAPKRKKAGSTQQEAVPEMPSKAQSQTAEGERLLSIIECLRTIYRPGSVHVMQPFPAISMPTAWSAACTQSMD